MKNRKFVSISLGLFGLCALACSAQEIEYDKYHRSSLYSILLKHPEKEFCNEMVEAFKAIPIPDKYNNHDLKIKVMPAPVMKTLTKDEIEGAYREAIEKILSLVIPRPSLEEQRMLVGKLMRKVKRVMQIQDELEKERKDFALKLFGEE